MKAQELGIKLSILASGRPTSVALLDWGMNYKWINIVVYSYVIMVVKLLTAKQKERII